jgi:hypothetical protein
MDSELICAATCVAAERLGHVIDFAFGVRRETTQRRGVFCGLFYCEVNYLPCLEGYRQRRSVVQRKAAPAETTQKRRPFSRMWSSQISGLGRHLDTGEGERATSGRFANARRKNHKETIRTHSSLATSEHEHTVHLCASRPCLANHNFSNRKTLHDEYPNYRCAHRRLQSQRRAKLPSIQHARRAERCLRRAQWWSAVTGKRRTKLDRLLEQGHWVALPMDGENPPCQFVMPTEELQSELEKELGKKIRKHLRDSGFERICATRRDHPFHSDLLRERIDALVATDYFGDREFKTPESIETTRRDLYGLIEETKKSLIPLTEYDIDQLVAQGIKANSNRVLWPKAYEFFRQMLRDPYYWRSTEIYKVAFPPDGPALPDGSARPKPVYVNKQHPDLVLQLQDDAVHFWIRCK